MQHHVQQQRFIYYINSTNCNTNEIQIETATDNSHDTTAMIQTITLYYIVLHYITRNLMSGFAEQIRANAPTSDTPTESPAWPSAGLT